MLIYINGNEKVISENRKHYKSVQQGNRNDKRHRFIHLCQSTPTSSVSYLNKDCTYRNVFKIKKEIKQTILKSTPDSEKLYS